MVVDGAAFSKGRGPCESRLLSSIRTVSCVDMGVVGCVAEHYSSPGGSLDVVPHNCPLVHYVATGVTSFQPVHTGEHHVAVPEDIGLSPGRGSSVGGLYTGA